MAHIIWFNRVEAAERAFDGMHTEEKTPDIRGELGEADRILD